jgi:hypothetical protein
MPSLFVLADERIERHALEEASPLRLDARGALAACDGGWYVSVVTFAPRERSVRRYALVAADTSVLLGARPVWEGVAEITDGDHVFLGAVEAIFSTDAVPAPVGTPARTPCLVCCETVGEGARQALLACPRCGARACDACWKTFPRGACMTPGCGQPAATDRPLWEPRLADFVDWEGER